MKQTENDPLSEFNQIYKKMNEIHHIYAKEHGVSDTELWLLYSLCAKDSAYTQREICSVWHYPPQTIHSALKKLQKNKLIELIPVPDNNKNKRIILTKNGKSITKKIILPLITAEQNAFRRLNEEQDRLLSLTKEYVDSLRKEIKEI